VSFNRNDIPCPWCGKVNDAHTALGDPDAEPENLDVSLCMSCGMWSLFCVHDDADHETHLRRPPGGVGYAHIISVIQEAVAA